MRVYFFYELTKVTTLIHNPHHFGVEWDSRSEWPAYMLCRGRIVLGVRETSILPHWRFFGEPHYR